jgi:pSer/pThr/pTyr-binding forkhead associated (FHA) protein/S1-C subfamily serine protease
MITITIGRSSDNKYVLSDNTQQCSSKHAEINISPNGGITITDFSLNGTFINNHRLPKYQPISVKRGDNIVFAKVIMLDWSKIPQLQQISNIKYNLKVGKDQLNNIILSGIDTSRNHANICVNTKGKVFIMDYSTNGTIVNGKKITSYQYLPIKRGTKVIFGNSDKLDWRKIPGGIPKSIIYSTVSLFILAISFSIWHYWPIPIKKVEDYSSSVVLVCNNFYLTRQYKEPAGNTSVLAYYGQDGRVVYSESELSKIKPFSVYGTGFIVSKDGKIITNRHVAEPWKDEDFKKYFLDTYLGPRAKMFNALYDLSVGGYIQEIGIIPNEKDVNKQEISMSLINCNTKTVKSHENPKVDLAIIQISAKNIPIGSNFVKTEDLILDKNEINVGDEVAITGFPLALGLWEEEKLTMKSTTDYGKVSMKKNIYELQYNANTSPGASGSPVICKRTGKVVAVNYAGYKADHNLGIFAYHIKDLIND